jgi:F420-dependent oxidoreductase-like protein
MLQLGIMIEGQEDLTWERLFRLAGAVEDLGFESLFRSDHLTALDGDSKRASLALWPSLAALALRTRRIRFGPLVCSVTFSHPSHIAKMAAAVDNLSGGRFELGIGAGWYRGEHAMFGIPYPRYETRLEMLDEGAQVIKALWRGEPVSFEGKHYRLQQAESYPVPVHSPPPLILGGKNEQKTLRLVAQYATEWNCTYIGVEAFKRKSSVLDEHCAAIGRDPATLRRSLMTPFVIGKDDATAQDRIEAHCCMFPSLPNSLSDWLAAGYIGGSPTQIVTQLKAFEAIGVNRALLQHNDLDDLASLELLAAEVLPHFAQT